MIAKFRQRTGLFTYKQFGIDFGYTHADDYEMCFKIIERLFNDYIKTSKKIQEVKK